MIMPTSTKCENNEGDKLMN